MAGFLPFYRGAVRAGVHVCAVGEGVHPSLDASYPEGLHSSSEKISCPLLRALGQPVGT